MSIISFPRWTALVKETQLAFVTQNTNNSEYRKRLKTGLNWAGQNHNQIDFDNVPTEGFEICAFTSRYSTDNKVFRVKDPRGWIFEIYADNLTALIKNNIIVNGLIKSPLVYTKNGANLYIATLDEVEIDTTVHSIKKVKVTELNEGDHFSYFQDSYLYLGEKHVVQWNNCLSARKRLAKTPGVPSHTSLENFFYNTGGHWGVENKLQSLPSHIIEQVLINGNDREEIVVFRYENRISRVVVDAQKPDSFTYLDLDRDYAVKQIKNVSIISKGNDTTITKEPFFSSHSGIVPRELFTFEKVVNSVTLYHKKWQLVYNDSEYFIAIGK